jgi:hypothetical protein
MVFKELLLFFDFLFELNPTKLVLGKCAECLNECHHVLEKANFRPFELHQKEFSAKLNL